MDTRKLGIAIVIAAITFAVLYFAIGFFVGNQSDCLQHNFLSEYNCTLSSYDQVDFLSGNRLIMSSILAVFAAGLFLSIAQQE